MIGHDTDTSAAIAGGLAGICYGREGIPEYWIEIYDLSYYSFSITSLGWYNIDKLICESDLIDFLVSTDEDLDVFLIIKNENICIRASKTKNGKYLFERIPSKKNARIIGYRQTDFESVNVVIQDVYLFKGEYKLKRSKEMLIGEFRRIIKK